MRSFSNPFRSTEDEDLPRLNDTVRLSAEGLAKILGDLETRVMRTVWSLGKPAPAKTVHENVAIEHPVALLTVVTVLNKLVDKGLLAREKQDGLLHYSARWNEGDFTAHALRHMLEGVLSFGPASVSASFVDVLAEQDPQQLDALRRLIEQRLKGQEEP